MSLSEDQQKIFEQIADVLNRTGIDLASGETGERRDRAAEEFAVLGKAGSGKTQLLAELALLLEKSGVQPVSPDYEYRKSDSRSFAVLAPTNKAASVLRRRGIPAHTIHRILYIPVYDPEFEKIAAWLGGDGGRPEAGTMSDEALDRAHAFFQSQKSVPAALAAAGIRGSDFITGWTRRDTPLDIGLIDEASMLDAQMMEDLREVFSTLIYFGDPAQLAPVGGGGEMPLEALPEERKGTLSQIHRQTADNPILTLAHSLWEPDMGFEEFEKLLRQEAARDERIEIAERVETGLMALSPVLVWRNATRIRLIEGFRKAYECEGQRLKPGEPLICDGIELPLKYRNKRIDLENRGLIKGAQVMYVGAGKKPGFSRLFVVGAENPRVNAASIIKIERPDQEEPDIPYAARMGAAFLHGSAVTIHKAQGSQWPTVQVFAPDLYAASRSGRSEAGQPLWKRLTYVALTRAEHRLKWVTRYRLSRPESELDADAILETLS